MKIQNEKNQEQIKKAQRNMKKVIRSDPGTLSSC